MPSMFSEELNDNNVPLARIVSSVPASVHACSVKQVVL